ncbi:methyltransferase [Breoghania sp.]|uniref:class I SAM-dependent methyltransferase n=1 Tax=Breoghania sp. TaxID=2065378 RepID=UPI002AA7B7BB|nr:methyltransferase [Breoghania sp.]
MNGVLGTIRTAEDRRDFILENTELLTPPLVPEISLHLATEVVELWEKTEAELEDMALPPPFWAFAWAGGQALSRYVLDNPGLVKGRRVLDFGAGSGMVSIAAAMAGATEVTAVDICAFAQDAILLNAKMNGVDLVRETRDILDEDPDVDVLLCGDVFYERPLAERVLAWIDRAQARGTEVLVGCPGRSYLPKTRLDEIAVYSVPVTRVLEDAEIKRTAVYRLKPVRAGQA